MGSTSSMAIAAGWIISPLRIESETGAVVGAVLFDPESETVHVIDDDARITACMEEGERGETESPKAPRAGLPV